MCIFIKVSKLKFQNLRLLYIKTYTQIIYNTMKKMGPPKSIHK